MADSMDDPDRLQTLHENFERRFDAIDAAIVEQRAYTEFAFERLDARVGQLEGRFGQLEGRFGQLEGRFGKLETQVGLLDGRVGQFERTMDEGFARVERRLDRILRVYPLKPPSEGTP